MGMKHWGIGALAAILVSVTTGAATPAVEAAPAPSAAVTEWQPTYDINPDLADELIAATPAGAEPDAVKKRWDCQLPINLDYAAAPGVDLDKLREQMAYPVRYLQGLGYYAAIGTEVPYVPSMPMPTTPGTVVIVATDDRTDQPALADGTHRGVAEGAGATSESATTGRVSVMSTNGMSSDVILHEIGHVLGLGHKDGTVMTATSVTGLGFDAEETAAIDCRP